MATAKLSFRDIAKVAYETEQTALYQVGGTGAGLWSSLTFAQQDAIINSVEALVLSGSPPSGGSIISSVGGSNAAKATNVFNTCVYALS